MCDKCVKVYQCIQHNHQDCFNRILETQDNETLILNNYIPEEDDEYDEEYKIRDLLRGWCESAINYGYTWYLDRIEEEFDYFYTSGLSKSCFRGNFEMVKYYISKIINNPEDHYLLDTAGLYRCAVYAQSVQIIEYLRTIPQIPIDKTIIESAVRNGSISMAEYLFANQFPYSFNLPKLAARHKHIHVFWYLVDELRLPFKNDQTMKLLDSCINSNHICFYPLRVWLISQYTDLVEREQTHLCPNIGSLLSERIKFETLVRESVDVSDDVLDYIVFAYI